MDLVILAAGMGSRFGGLKQIEPMDEYGNFIIDYSIYDAIEAGFDKVVFIIKEELLDDFKETVGNRISKKIKVEYVFQKNDDLPAPFSCPENRHKPWGTAHALLAAEHAVSDNFVIINADDYYGKDSYKVAANYLRGLKDDEEGKYANVTFETRKTITENGSVKRGVCFGDENGYLKKMIESSVSLNSDGSLLATPLDKRLKPFAIDAKQSVSMNMFVFTRDIFAYLKAGLDKFLNENKDNLLDCEYLIPDVVTSLIYENKVSVKLIPTTSTWYGVTYYTDKENVVNSFKEMVDKGLYTKGLWK